MKTYKLLSAEQFKQWDSQTMKIQNISSIDLMERAATNIFKKILKNEKEILKKHTIDIFCGIGNNGGDGLVLARLFHQKGFDVRCIIVPFSTKTSKDFDTNLHRLMQLPIEIETFTGQTKISKKSIVIDAIFGTGLSRPAAGIAQEAIKLINQSKAQKILSIDIPSGLYVDKPNAKNDLIVKSDCVYTIELPKLSFFYPQNIEYVKDYKIVKIGLEKQVLKKLPTDKFTYKIQPRKVLKRPDNSYKNIFGHALIIGGSLGMIGAAMLSSKAALRIGAGLVSAYIPKCGYIPFQTAVPEIMVKTDKNKKYISKIDLSNAYQAIGIGPGLGTHKKTQKAVLEFFSNQDFPLVIDADALNILSLNKEFLNKIPKNSILTPHPGEFKRLTGKTWNNDLEKIQSAKAFANKYQIILVLKGAFTLITNGKKVFINPYANSALATAGSGDVLTGIITGLLTQGFHPFKAAKIGVQLHSQAAEIFDDDIYLKSSMVASDIIKNLKFF